MFYNTLNKKESQYFFPNLIVLIMNESKPYFVYCFAFNEDEV